MDTEGKHRAERPTLWQRITPELMYCFLFGALVRYLRTDLRIRNTSCSTERTYRTTPTEPIAHQKHNSHTLT